MGKAAGCKTCAVTWGSHTKARLLEEQPTFCVDTFEQLLALGD
ncbi:HAD hydrolase-like protein [Lysinibacillus sp. KU-BSD001]